MGRPDPSYILEELGCLSLLFINNRSKSVMDRGPVARKPWQIEERPLTQRAWPVIWPCASISETCHGWWWLLQIMLRGEALIMCVGN